MDAYFLGTHPTLTQVPPQRWLSMTATLAPYCAARRAEAMPPEPPPITCQREKMMTKKKRGHGYYQIVKGVGRVLHGFERHVWRVDKHLSPWRIMK